MPSLPSLAAVGYFAYVGETLQCGFFVQYVHLNVSGPAPCAPLQHGLFVIFAQICSSQDTRTNYGEVCQRVLCAGPPHNCPALFPGPPAAARDDILAGVLRLVATLRPFRSPGPGFNPKTGAFNNNAFTPRPLVDSWQGWSPGGVQPDYASVGLCGAFELF